MRILVSGRSTIWGGGRDNSVSVIEAIARLEGLIGKRLKAKYVGQPRRGDHICYISNMRRFKSDYSDWEITRPLDSVLEELGSETLY